jgi:hypothetical protein
LYPAAGTTQLTFFQAGIGSGLATALGSTAGTPKTKADTNLEIGSTLPSGKSYLIESIEVFYYAGSVSTANTYTPASVSVFAAVAAAAVIGAANDVNLFYQGGTLELNILSKNYLRGTPLQLFPPKTQIDVSGFADSKSATTSEVAVSVTHAIGRPFYVEPNVTLQPAVNFEVVITWPGLVAMSSGFNGRAGIVMDGWFQRASQ